MLRKAPDTGIALHSGPFTTEGNVETGGGTRLPGTLKDGWRGALKTEHLSAKDPMKGTLREGSFTGDPDRYVNQGSDVGVCFDRGPAFGERGGTLLS